MSKYYSAEFEDIKNCIIGPCWYMMEITDIIKIKFLTIYKFIFIDHIHNIKKPSFNCLFLNASRTGGYIDFFSNDIKSNKQTNFHIP